MADLFKFRCSQCSRLIGAPPSRFGTVIKCPRCGSELIVPAPNWESRVVEDDEADAFRPEDLGLRIEPEPIARPSVRPMAVNPPDGPNPTPFLQVLEAGGTSERVEDKLRRPEVEPPDLPDPEVGPIGGRTSGRKASRLPALLPRARDVVIPRTAAVAWALFALIALAFAFATGLLVGQRLGR